MKMKISHSETILGVQELPIGVAAKTSKETEKNLSEWAERFERSKGVNPFADRQVSVVSDAEAEKILLKLNKAQEEAVKASNGNVKKVG